MNNLICVLEECEDLTVIPTLLLGEHYQVASAGTIVEFSNILPGPTPALFLIDIILPDGNELSVCEHIKTNLSTAQIPVLIMAANIQLHKMKEWAYADDCIAKLFDIDDLQNRITKLIETKDN